MGHQPDKCIEVIQICTHDEIHMINYITEYIIIHLNFQFLKFTSSLHRLPYSLNAYTVANPSIKKDAHCTTLRLAKWFIYTAALTNPVQGTL